uniref:Putative zn-ribbon-containing protein implicated in mitosis n=1 Tax=Amblyomma aureolatum TaxID=187763 RepID=A0A1E1XBD9_9ACAR
MEDYDWKPPTEAELKVLEARRERMDKISGIMGDYLLKGYKMLSDVCDVCSTILLEDRQRKTYCIACSEVDTMENVKDNPVLSDAAAQRLVQECQASSEMTAQSHSTLSSEETHHSPAPPLVPRGATTVISSNAIAPAATPNATASMTTACMLAARGPGGSSFRSQQQMVGNGSAPLADSAQRDQEVVAAMQAVQGKMVWATQELKMCSSVELSIQMCSLIKTCAEAITALNDLRATEAEPVCAARQVKCE